MTRMFVLATMLTACSTVPNAVEQADLVIAAYEAHYADISDADVECIRDVRVRYARLGNESVERCGSHNVGCTVSGPLHARIWIGNGLEPRAETYALRHEYTHTLLWCMTGNAHGDHDVPEFGYSAVANAPGSLADLADELEDP